MTAKYLKFWGVRGSYPAPFKTHLRTGGNTSCVEIRDGGHLVVCDAGTGIIPLGNALMQQSEIREITLILTHYHWDHISGLPFFVPAFVPGWKINIFGPGQKKDEVEKNLADQMKAPFFPVEVENWQAEVNYLEAENGCVEHGPIRIEHFNVHHPGSTYGYRIHIGGKKLVYASDNELAFINQSIDQRKHEFDEPEQKLLDDMKEEAKARSIAFMNGVDVLIHDSQYTPRDYAQKRGWGHSCYIDTVNSAVEASVKRLFLFHHDPNYPDEVIDELHTHSLEIVRERNSNMDCQVAREDIRMDLDD